MNQDNVVQFEGRELFNDALTSLLQRGAQQLIMQSVEAELDEFMSQRPWPPLRYLFAMV